MTYVLYLNLKEIVHKRLYRRSVISLIDENNNILSIILTSQLRPPQVMTDDLSKTNLNNFKLKQTWIRYKFWASSILKSFILFYFFSFCALETKQTFTDHKNNVFSQLIKRFFHLINQDRCPLVNPLIVYL